MVKTKEYEAFAKELKAYEKVIKAEYAGIEDAVSIKLKECEAPKERIAADVAAQLTKAVVGCPDGVQRMSVWCRLRATSRAWSPTARASNCSACCAAR